MTQHNDLSLFNLQSPLWIKREDYLNVDQFLLSNQESFFRFQKQQTQLSVQEAEEQPYVQPFVFTSTPNTFQIVDDQLIQQQKLTYTQQSSVIQILDGPQEKTANSIKTKNVCFNICQKTIKVIQKQTYHKKLEQICRRHNVDTNQFIQHIVKEKRRFSGPKALLYYIQQQKGSNLVFKQFMRWFLIQKYLRHCLSGDMKDKEAYIKFKNEQLIPMLQ